MVALDLVKASNATIPNELPAEIVAVFVGGTSGIGELALRKLASLAQRPKIYIAGRNADAAARIIADLRVEHPSGQYEFIQSGDLTLIKETQKLVEEIEKRVEHINILMLSSGAPILEKEPTSEGLRPLFAVGVLSHILMAERLMPLIQKAPYLRRVVNVAAGGYEDKFDPEDPQALKIAGRYQLRACLASVTSIGLQRLVKDNPEVSFVHEFPGLVATNIFNRLDGWIGFLFRCFVFLFGWLLAVPNDECAERHVFMATSAALPPAKGDAKGIPLVDGTKEGAFDVVNIEEAVGADGEFGSGFYSIGWDQEGPGEKVTELLKTWNEDGTADQIRGWMQGELKRILD